MDSDSHAAQGCASVNFPGDPCDCLFDDPAWRELLPPTHPDGPRRMRVVPCDDLRDDERVIVDPRALRAGHAYAFSSAPAEREVAEPAPARQLPKPPPAGLDPVKWATLGRAERRALLRHHRKQVGR